MKNNEDFGNMIDKLLKETPLETRLRVSFQMSFINLITELGYRESKMWGSDEDETLKKLCDLAENLLNDTLQNIKEWENDGKP
jgi:hypothetical protein